MKRMGTRNAYLHGGLDLPPRTLGLFGREADHPPCKGSISEGSVFLPSISAGGYPGLNGAERLAQPHHRLNFQDAGAHGILERVGFVGDRMSSEQRIEIESNAIVNVFAVERNDLRFGNVDTRATQHP